jgi:adenosine deaminase
MTSQPSAAQIIAAPKVLLHDHLDGGLRAASMIEMAQECGYRQLPFYDATELANWYEESCSSGSLELYLETFSHTIALMQTQEQIIRVARECVLDLAATGVVYAEVRGAPELFVRKGLTLSQVIEATVEGYRQGMSEVKSAGKSIRVESLLCAMRQNNLSEEIAHLVVQYRNRGVVGFDIAGPEKGFPPTDHIKAFNYLQANNAHYTIHAGEAFSIESIRLAVNACQAQRIGHGIRLIDDITFTDGKAILGELAQKILDEQIPLEMAPTSNIQTGGAPSYAEHQIGPMKKLGFKVTLNTDNRLMSNTSMVKESTEILRALNWDLRDLQDLTENAITEAFIPEEERNDILINQIRPGYLALV